MAYAFQHTNLWKRAFEASEGDDELARTSKQRLQVAYMQMREQVAALVKTIPEDCKGLTVHDETHLDALWEYADLIAGPDFLFTPAEAFVFGGGVLLHDSGMTVAAYPGGLNEIAEDVVWSDIAHHILRKRGILSPTPEQIQTPPPEFKQEILFSVLRALHARRAEELPVITWPMPGKPKELVYVLEDAGLRNAYGRSIGRVAHSHHWSLEDVATKLNPTAGIAPQLPSSWTLNEIKVACLLRCADAAHIDQRRAPRMLYALSSPVGASAPHWQFQSKINKPTARGDTLVYSSNIEFPTTEAAAWWLCYDTIQMVNKELSGSSALLQDRGLAPFRLKRVFGTESPEVLAQQIRTADWRPVDAEIRVSDPIGLASTLGGSTLYGQGNTFVSVRELLQNAVDAVRARRILQSRANDWGEVRVTIEESHSEWWLHVDDNGLGMSERVLTGPLVDFGRSFWASSLLREEFPGLETRNPRPIGKFGIGFFSAFLLGACVRVISKRYDAGESETKTLAFDSLATRPLLRKAGLDELPQDFSTRVSVRLDNYEKLLHSTEISRIREPTGISFVRRVTQLVAGVDVNISIKDGFSGDTLQHKPDWLNSDPQVFIERLYHPQAGDAPAKNLARYYAPMLRPLVDAKNNIYGRAALRVGRDDRLGNQALVSVGGFVYPRSAHGLNVPAVGLIQGDTQIAARSFAVGAVPDAVVAAWATEQATLVDPTVWSIDDEMRAAAHVLRAGGDPGSLRIAFLSGKFVNQRELEAQLRDLSTVLIPLVSRYDSDLSFLTATELTTRFHTRRMANNVVIKCVEERQQIFDERHEVEQAEVSGVEKIDKDSIDETAWEGGVGFLYTMLERLWKCSPSIAIRKSQIFSDAKHGRTNSSIALTLKKDQNCSETC